MNFMNNEDSDDGGSFKINQDYAKRYDKWRKSEELQKLKDKYGDNYEEDSSTSEDEDDDAVELTEEIEKDFFKTLSCLKEKNPKIYDENVRFFKDKEVKDEATPAKKPKEETLSMAAYQRKMLLETNGVIEESDGPSSFDNLPHAEQEKAIKDSFKKALRDSDDDGGDDLLKAKVRTKEEKDKEEADYRQWLAGQPATIPEETELKGLRDFWANPQLDEGEKFLRDYILNHKYLEKGNEEEAFDVESEDEEMEKKQDEFERKYNYRYQEPDQDFIKRYPRTVEQSMRRKDDKRKKQREDLKARKQAERLKKDEELKRLKALKRAEIMEKIQKLQKVTGNEDMTFQDEDIEGDFNPEEHDKRMSELFNKEFYSENVDEEKPEFPDLDEELEIEKWDEWGGETQGKEAGTEIEPHCEDPGFVMDCDYDPKAETQQELLSNSRKRRKRRQSKFAQAVSQPKPVFDPKNTTFEKYLDEYYALDYEDLIGDIPCRFKYRKVVPNDFGLSVEEILAAPDKELNRWASSKKIMQRRPEHIEHYEVKAYQRKAKNFEKKKQCLPTLYAPPEEEEENNEADQEIINSQTKKKQPEESNNVKQIKPKKNKKKQKAKIDTQTTSPPKKKAKNDEPRTRPKKKVQPSAKPENHVENFVTSLTASRLKSFGLNPKKFKNKIKYGKK